MTRDAEVTLPDAPADAGGGEGGQTRPPMGPPAASPAFFLMGLGRRVRDDLEAILAQNGMALRHLSALGHLARQPGLSYSALGRRAGVTPQSMQATLAQLEQRGAVDKRTQSGKGRTAELHLTPAGQQLLALGQQALALADEHVLAGLTTRQRRELTDLLLQVFSRAVQPGPDAG